MSFITAVFYGIIQGLTEFLPISSSGHLSVIRHIFGLENLETSYFSFDILLHMATLAAVIIIYWKDVLPLIPAFFTMCAKAAKKIFTHKGRKKRFVLTASEKLCLLVIIATLPLVAAVFLKDYVEALSESAKIIGGILILNAAVLFISDILPRGKKEIIEAKPKNALIVGLCQMCAIVPGLSRSGSTITGGLTQGFTREFAVKFSFILSIPAIIGANVFNIPDLLSTPVAQSDILAYAAGMAAALIAGIAAMKLLIFISKKATFKIFSIYCLIVGILAIIFG